MAYLNRAEENVKSGLRVLQTMILYSEGWGLGGGGVGHATITSSLCFPMYSNRAASYRLTNLSRCALNSANS